MIPAERPAPAPAGTGSPPATTLTPESDSEQAPAIAETIVPTTPDTERRRSIDLLRGIAVLVMIGAHASSALLAGSYRQGPVWDPVNILFGFVAPAYLFLAGITLQLASLRRNETSAGARRWAGPRHALRLVFLGYWLQIPILSLRQLIWCHRPSELARLFDVNILQAIGLSSLIPLGLLALFHRPRPARAVALLIALGLALATPWIWRGGLDMLLPGPLAPLVAPQPRATFPLAPYAAYLLAGFGLAVWLARAERRAMGTVAIAIIGAAMLAAGRLLPPVPPHDDLWGSSIHHLLFRLGGVLLALGICAAISRRLPMRITAIEWIGRRSLPLYLLHLMIIYGSPVNAGLRTFIGGEHPPGVAIAATLGALGIGALLVLGWERLAAARPAWTRALSLLAWLAFWAVFLTKP